MNILVTGGCGFIGTQLTQALLAHGHNVIVVDIMWFGNFLKDHSNLKIIQCDIRDHEKIPMKNIQAIFHLANIANDPCSDLDPKLSWEVNVLASMQLVERAINYDVQQFVFASSGSVYGVKKELDVTEDLPLVPISDYNKTKMISERVLLSYSNRIIVQCIRPATVCGYSPRMRLDLSVNMLTMQALSNGIITVFGGAQTRPNIHIQDLVRVYLHFLELEPRTSGIYNAGFENLTIMEIAERVAALIPSKISVMGSNDPRSYRLNSKKLLDTGFKPRHTVSDAMDELICAKNKGILKDDNGCYNLRVMKALRVR